MCHCTSWVTSFRIPFVFFSLSGEKTNAMLSAPTTAFKLTDSKVIPQLHVPTWAVYRQRLRRPSSTRCRKLRPSDGRWASQGDPRYLKCHLAGGCRNQNLHLYRNWAGPKRLSVGGYSSLKWLVIVFQLGFLVNLLVAVAAVVFVLCLSVCLSLSLLLYYFCFCFVCLAMRNL